VTADDRVVAFLADANLRPGFAARARARIKAADVELTTAPRPSLGWLVSELYRHAEEIAAQSAIIAARFEIDAGRPVDDRRVAHISDRRARALLTAATQRAGDADALLGELHRLVRLAA
jgi:hypothetical protein